MNKITLLIADDHKLVREGLKQLLELERIFQLLPKLEMERSYRENFRI